MSQPAIPGNAAPPAPMSLLGKLLAEPARFGLDAAAAVMMRAAGQSDPGAATRFQAVSSLGFVASDVIAVKFGEAAKLPASQFRATTGLMGLTGPSGVLPRPYTELVHGERRARSPALGAFLDVLAQRPIAQFVQAGIKYRPHRSADAASIASAQRAPPPTDSLRLALLALTGYGTPGLSTRLLTGTDPVLYHAGTFATWPRSADRLAGMLSDWLGRTVTVEQFAGRWVRLDPSERSALPGKNRSAQFNWLGVDASAGKRIWDIQSRIELRIGPLDLRRFEALMPSGSLLPRLMALVQAYLGGEIAFTVRPILAANAVPPPRLGGGAIRLGWNGWLPARHRKRDADEAVFGSDATRGDRV